MSVKVSSWVWQHAPANGNALLVLLALADQADDAGVCWPSQTYLASKTRLSESTVRRSVRMLREAGVISVVKVLGQANRYSIELSHPGHTDPTPGQSDTPVILEPLSPVTSAPVTSDLTPRSPLTSKTSRTINNRDTAIPGGFVVTADMRKWAAQSVPAVNIDRATEDFVDYWRNGNGRGKKKKNWEQAWRTWMRKLQTDAERRGWKPARPDPDGWMNR